MPAANTGNIHCLVMQALQGLGNTPHFRALPACKYTSLRLRHPTSFKGCRLFIKGKACCESQLNRTRGLHPC